MMPRQCAASTVVPAAICIESSKRKKEVLVLAIINGIGGSLFASYRGLPLRGAHMSID